MTAGRHRSGRPPARVRAPVLLLQAAVVAGLVGGTTAFVVADERSLTLSVDGVSRSVSSPAGTVGGVLKSEGISVDLAHDFVTPALRQDVHGGETVVVRHGRPVLLTVDGETRTVWTTARSVAEALMMLGVRSDGAYLSASRSRRIGRGGMRLDVRTEHAVTFLADRKRHEITTTAPTLRTALAEAGVRLRARDRVSADLSAMPYSQQVVGVTRVHGKRVVQHKPIRFKRVERKSDDLFVGQTRVLKRGKVGIRVKRFVETYADGKLESRNLVGYHVAEEPQTEVVLVGTKPVPENTPAADGLNWAALADCESGGNPQAVNGAGPYYGLYQFAASTWAAVGGAGLPIDHGADEQTYRAQLLYERSGAGQWPECGRLLFT